MEKKREITIGFRGLGFKHCGSECKVCLKGLA